MLIYIIFGLPGAGKTYVGNIFKEDFNFYFYEGDKELTKEMKQAIKNQTLFTQEMRNDFFEKIIRRVRKLKKEYKNIVIAQTFIKEKYRNQFLTKFKNAKFILVQAQDSIRETRLDNRRICHLDKNYARKMCLDFDKPEIEHQVINNNKEGKEDVRKQISSILSK